MTFYFYMTICHEIDIEGVGSDITTLPEFVRAKFTRFENWESTSSAGRLGFQVVNSKM
jgi:hypothetical protein